MTITIKNVTRGRSKGFTLLELILVLGIGSLAMLSFIQMELKRQETMAAEIAGGQLNEVGNALGTYITMNNSTLQTAVPMGTTSAAIPLSVMQSSTGTYAIGGVAVSNQLLLPTTYVNRLSFPTVSPTTYSVYLKNSNGTITGLVVTDSAVIDKTGATRFDWLGTAMKKAGSQAGLTFTSATSMSGPNGAWTLSNTDFSNINAIGEIGYRVAYQGNYDNTYLRLDGMYPMNGNLNMGNYNIKNATDISYTGWLYGNNGVMNNLVTGTITNAGNITTQSINGKTTVLGASNASDHANTTNSAYSYANFDIFYANCINCGFSNDTGTVSTQFNANNGDVRIGQSGNAGALFVKDIMLGANGSAQTPKNAFLSDRLPRYADRGVAVMADGDSLPKPVVTTSTSASGYVCRWTGEGNPPVAKIEVIPAMQWVQGAVLGTMQLSFAGSSMNSSNQLILNGSIYQDQYSLGAFQAYATDNGTSWTVYARTAPYNSSYYQGTALAHIYCDYGN